MKKKKIIPLFLMFSFLVVGCANKPLENGDEENVLDYSQLVLGTPNSNDDTNNFIITVDLNGGTTPDIDTNEFEVRKGTLWKYAKKLLPSAADITYDYHTFDKYLLDGETILDSFSVTSDITIVASYTIVEGQDYEVHWKNGSTDLVAAETYGAGETPTYKGTLPSEPTNPTAGHIYEFNGWDPAINVLPERTGSESNVITYTAQFKDVTDFDVTFNHNYDNITFTSKVVNGSQVAAPSTPTRTGYTFGGWYDAATDGNTVTFPLTITSNTTIYAHWSLETVTISYDPSLSHDETGLFTKIINKGDRATFYIPTSIPTGYVFDKWVLHGETSAYDFESSVTSNIRLDACYTTASSETVTVYFVSNNGSTIPNQNPDSSGKITAPTEPTRTGFTFGGWFKDAGFANEFDFTTDTVTSSMVLYAKWTQIQFTINFKESTASDSQIFYTKTVNYGDFLPLVPNPTASRKTFNGWCDQNGNPIDFSAPVTSAFDVFAKWVTNLYSVVFASNGGSHVNSQTVAENITIDKPTDPTKTGYTFGGWYKDDGVFEKPFSFNGSGSAEPITRNIVLFAKWTIKTITVTFDVGDVSTSIVPSQTVNYGDKLYKPEPPTLEDHVFSKWVDSNSQEFDFTSPVTASSNFTLTAVYDLIVDRITFNTNGGSAVSPQNVTRGEHIYASPVTTRQNYAFDGWYFDDNTFENKVVFGAGQSASTFTGDTVLHAKWVQEVFTVSWMDSDYETVITTTTCNRGDYPLIPQSLITTPPTKESTNNHRYVFDGWINSELPVYKDVDIFPNFVYDDYVTFVFDSTGGFTVNGEAYFTRDFKFNSSLSFTLDECLEIERFFSCNIYVDDMFIEDGLGLFEAFGMFDSETGTFNYSLNKISSLAIDIPEIYNAFKNAHEIRMEA